MDAVIQTIQLSIFEVFEKMFFIFLEPLQPQDANETYGGQASIHFGGSIKGELQLMLSERMQKAMVLNMLNLDESEVSDQVIQDCSKEAANMVCGNFLAKFDPSNAFDLAIPEYADLRGQSTVRTSSDIKLDFVSDDGEMRAVCIIS